MEMTVVYRTNTIMNGTWQPITLGLQVQHINGWATSVFSESAYIPNLNEFGYWCVNGEQRDDISITPGDPNDSMDSPDSTCFAGFPGMQGVNYGLFYKNVSTFGLAPNSSNTITFTLHEPGKPLQICNWNFQVDSSGTYIPGYTLPMVPCIYDGDDEETAAIGADPNIYPQEGEEEEHLEEEDTVEPPPIPNSSCSCGPPYNIGGGFTLEGFSYSASNGEVVFKHGENKIFGFRYDAVTGVVNSLYRATAPGSVTQILI
jgi:hypothetical protein